MDILKGHKSKIFAAVFIAIIGVGFGVIPYFSVAAIINNLVAKNANLNNYYPYIFAVFLDFWQVYYFMKYLLLFLIILPTGLLKIKESY